MNMMLPAIIPAAGMVNNQDSRITLIMGQWVLCRPLTSPTPAIEPVTVCVVDTGTPHSVAAKMIAAALASAVQPSRVLRDVILVPMVVTMRQPPSSVPKLIIS